MRQQTRRWHRRQKKLAKRRSGCRQNIGVGRTIAIFVANQLTRYLTSFVAMKPQKIATRKQIVLQRLSISTGHWQKLGER